MADALAARCAEHHVAYLMWTTGDLARIPQDALIIRTEPPVMSASEVAAAPDTPTTPQSRVAFETLHAALDLLVDGEKGLWRLPNTW